MGALIRLLILGVFSLMLNTFFTYAQAKNNAQHKSNSHALHKVFNLNGAAQGTSYNIRYYELNPIINKSEIDSLFGAIDKSLSVYNSSSTISLFNASKEGVFVDSHLKKVLLKTNKVYRYSKQEFDPTIAPLLKLWDVGLNKGGKDQNSIPSTFHLQAALEFVGYHNVKLKGNYLSKLNPNVKINLDGIAQGYSVDVLYRFLKSKGLSSFLIELGGEIRVLGVKPDGERYRIAIDLPIEYSLSSPMVALNKGAITTSGIKQSSDFIGNKWLTPQLNPKTGKPIESSILTATVYAKNAMDADAYDQLFYSKNIDESIRFAQRKLKIGLFLYYLDDQGNIQSIWNRRFQKILINSAQFKIYEN